MDIGKNTQVEYEHTANSWRAYQWLQDLPDLFAADFETASLWSSAGQQELLKIKLNLLPEDDAHFEQRRELLQKLEADGLSHPSLTCITHLSVAWSDHEAKVIICADKQTRELVCNFLAETEKKQLWHNATFDFKHILWNAHRLPKNYVDTMLLAKCILNDANQFKNDVRLKSLMAYAYGAWAISKDNFTLDEMYDENMIKYSATDACATYKLYQDILKDQNNVSS